MKLPRRHPVADVPRHEPIIAARIDEVRREHAERLREPHDVAARLETDVTPLPPGFYPARSPLEGRYARMEPLNPLTHAEELWDACRRGVDTDRTWDYMGYGPFTSLDAFRGWLRDLDGGGVLGRDDHGRDPSDEDEQEAEEFLNENRVDGHARHPLER